MATDTGHTLTLIAHGRLELGQEPTAWPLHEPGEQDIVAAEEEGPADVLVCDETPGVHPDGFPVLDEFARDIGAKWIIQGHQYQPYEDATHDGMYVRGLDKAESWRWPEAVR